MTCWVIAGGNHCYLEAETRVAWRKAAGSGAKRAGLQQAAVHGMLVQPTSGKPINLQTA